MPEELLRMNLAPSDGYTPAGTLALIHALATQAARRTGAALPAEADQHRPEKHAERSGKIVAAESLAVHAIDQAEAANPGRVAERDRLLADGNVAALAAMHAEALNELQTLLAEMAAAGFAVKFELTTAEVPARTGE
ncbi:hypothetical protein FTUN_0158 [Frigoriglobus tundricola]|uniref:Uncharacterized protein n=2 Tax=Frigoriglobus tundricola TaxID=2774151 RepID=A0A6M5YH27_9BACT|nr:hypothetical protein FTUN_0158 [Frigoriglobus tundricola]